MVSFKILIRFEMAVAITEWSSFIRTAEVLMVPDPRYKFHSCINCRCHSLRIRLNRTGSQISRFESGAYDIGKI